VGFGEISASSGSGIPGPRLACGRPRLSCAHQGGQNLSKMSLVERDQPVQGLAHA
jgi:hypothetical protein